MARRHLGLLTLGAFLIIVAVSIAAWISNLIAIQDVVPIVVLFTGLWSIAVAGIRAFSYADGDGAFSTFGWGMLLTVIGGSWFLNTQGMPIMFTVVFILLLLGVLAVAASLRTGRKQE